MSIISNCGAVPFEPPRVGSQSASGAAAAAASGPSVSNLSGPCPESGELMHALKKITSPRSLSVSALRCVSKTIPQNTPIMSKMIRFLSPKAPLGPSTVRMARILSFLSVENVVKSSSDLPANYDGYEIDDLLLYAKNLSPYNYFIERNPRCKVIDESVWLKCFGKEALDALKLSFDGLSVPKEDLGFLRKVNQFASVPVEGNAGFTLLILPNGLTLNKLRALVTAALAAAPQPDSQASAIEYIHSLTVDKYENTSVEGGVVTISNGLLTGSRNSSIAAKSKLLESHGCQMPPLAAAVALLFLTRINSSTTATGPVYLLGSDPLSYTRCIEQIQFQGSLHHLVVGGSSRSGIGVYFGVNFAQKECGVVALRKL